MRLITLLLLCTLVVYPAFAEDDPGFYVGVSVGQASLDGAVTGNIVPIPLSVDDEDTQLVATVGYDTGKWFAVELSYVDLGETSEDLLTLEGPSFGRTPLPPPNPILQLNTSVRGLTLSGLGRYEFAPRFSVFGRAGVSAMRVKVEQVAGIDWCTSETFFFFVDTPGFNCAFFQPVTFPAGSASSDTDTEYTLMFGLGFSADITDHFIGRLDYTEYDLETLDASAMSLSLLYKF